jgi:hypothetical protein
MQKRQSKQELEPRVGIFWLVRNKLVIDSSSVSRAKPYGERLTFPNSHIHVWRRLQLAGRVPVESEYDEFPRGRVMYHPSSDQFTILADPCIFKCKRLIAEIKEVLNLPNQARLGSDPHYRCWTCLYGNQEGDDDE